jgi:tetratricopeptide (TPR) repeat protein
VPDGDRISSPQAESGSTPVIETAPHHPPSNPDQEPAVAIQEEDQPFRRRREHGPRTGRWIVLTLLLAGVAASWYYYFDPSRSRTFRVKIYTDLSFRQGRDWQGVVRSRLEAVNRIYRDTVQMQWEISSIDAVDPGAALPTMEERRQRLAAAPRGSEDLALCLTSAPEPDHKAAVMPFSHAAVVADSRTDSESANSLRLAHELAHLFGAEHEPGTLMADPPDNARFAPRAVSLLRTLKRYDFQTGVAALQSFWGVRAAAALRDDGSGLIAMPEANAHLKLAQSLVADGQTKSAVEQYRLALQANPKDNTTRIQLAHTLAADSRQDEAIKLLREGVEASPRDVILRAGLAGLLQSSGHPIQGLEEINQAIRMEPDNANAQLVRAAILAGEPGFIDQSIAGFETALRLDASLAAARKGLEGARATKATALDDAKLFQERVVRANPQNAAARYKLGVLELRGGQLEAAREEFQKSATLSPREGQSYLNLAAIDFIRRDFRSAAANLQRARETGIEPPADLASAIERQVIP